MMQEVENTWLDTFVEPLSCRKEWEVLHDRGGAHAIVRHKGHSLVYGRVDPTGPFCDPELNEWAPTLYWLIEKGRTWQNPGASYELTRGRLGRHQVASLSHVLDVWEASQAPAQEVRQL